MACPLFRVIVVVLLAGAAAAAAESRTWQLMHSFDSGLTFTNRGQISLALNDEGSIEISVTNADDFIAWPTVNSITDPKILYQIKLLKDEHDDSMAILTSVSVCQLRRASFRYVLTTLLRWDQFHLFFGRESCHSKRVVESHCYLMLLLQIFSNGTVM